MDERIKKLCEQEWKNDWSGPWLLLECYFYGDVYTRVLKEKLGVGLSTAAFIFKGKIGANFFLQDELRTFGKEIAERISKDISMALNWGNTTKKFADEALALMDSVKGRGIRPEDFHDLWGIIYEYQPINSAIKFSADHYDPKILEKLLPIFSEVRIHGEPVYAQSALFVKRFALQIANKTGLTQEHVLYFTRKELDEYFISQEIPARSILEERYRKSVLIMANGNEVLLTGQAAEEFEKRILNIRDSAELKGTTAYKGVAKGRVRIVFDPENAPRFNEPTVLVTGMTRPEYMHLIKSAVAVVTDAGGILSHAAITARELKKPCIIGTKFATQILKDGDMVEVDADKGIVRKL